MKLGMICRMDNSGLGTLSWEFARNLRPHKVLLVENFVHKTFPERYDGLDSRRAGKSYGDHLEWFLEDIDVVLTFETFYRWEIVKICRQKNIKTVLYTMVEMTSEKMPLFPDLFLCPSKLDYERFREPKVFIPTPVATDRLIWNKRETAHTFIHSASHGGVGGRKGTQLFLDAIPKVKADVKFVIYSWRPFESNDPRLEVKVQNFKNYWQIWREGDVLVYPQDYNGICLPIVEAMASGMGVITTDIYPFNEYMPKELMFQPRSMYKTRCSPSLLEVDAAKIDPEDIAAKIDEWANKDISRFSEYGRTWAEQNSWEALGSKIRATLEALV